MSLNAYVEDGKLVNDMESDTSTWTHLLEHASFPGDATTVRKADVEVFAGTFPAVARPPNPRAHQFLTTSPLNLDLNLGGCAKSYRT